MTSDKSLPGRSIGNVEVQRAILARIARGEFRVGDRLPSCDELAIEFGVNKNTVNRAYQGLRDAGYLDSAPGRGTFVRRRSTRRSIDRAEVERLALLLFQEAKLVGLDRASLMVLLDDLAARYFGRRSVRVGFVECTSEEAALLSRDLQVALGHPVAPLLLDDAVADPGAALAAFDVLGTPLAHQPELEAAVAGMEGGPRVIGLLVSPDAESLASIVRLRPGTRVAIVCDLQETTETLQRLISAYNPHLVLASVMTGDPAAVSVAMRDANVVVATLSATERLRQLELPVPTVTVRFQLDAGSIAELGRRMDEVTAERPPLQVLR